mmetsp:Transcript_5254/g.6834  ORF Transcript_5254/g.6834 Transcript_5254/m.6834 type:complete len:248 (-) Transcript_5254:223-966(-)
MSCTVARCIVSNAGCFMQEQESGERAYGLTYCIFGELCCTKNKMIAIDEETDPYTVTIPPIGDLGCRTACCCQYCGFSCDPEYSPCGIAVQLTALCLQDSCGLSLVTGEADKRACVAINCIQNCLSCEETATSNNDEFMVLENAFKGLGCCCCESGCTGKVSCCPRPIVCLGQQQQCCCCYGRTAFPCNDLVPCEIGLCGIFCINKTDLISDEEARLREKAAENAPVEAVIVSTNKGEGALNQRMQR